MANQVFNSFASYLSKQTFNKCEHTSFNFKPITNLTATYGALIPFFLEDCVPTDSFRFKRCVVKCQALPMATPLFNDIRLNTWFFFVPYQSLWHKFHRFIDGGKNGTYYAEEPYIKAKFSRNSLGDYLGFPIIEESGSSNDPIECSAYPFAAYQSIYKWFFMNQDLQTTGKDANNKEFDDWWYPADDNKFSLHDGLCWIMDEDDTTIAANQQYDSGTGNSQLYDVDSTNGTITTDMLKEPILCAMRFHNFNKDYFTTAMFSPQRGPAQGVNVINPNSPFTASDFDDLIKVTTASSGSLSDFLDVSTTNFQFSFNKNPVSTDPDNPNVPLQARQVSSATGDLVLPNVKAQLAYFFNSILAKQGTSAFTISDLMVASQIELWYQRNMQVKSQYDEFLQVHFGFSPKDENYKKPVFIGGTTQLINVSEVIQTSESSTTPQGTRTGLANSYSDDFVGDIFCNDYGLIMGIMCIMPDIYYTNGFDKKWRKRTRFDYIFPEFAQLPPEPIYNYEIYCKNSSDGKSLRVFGYAGRYDNYRHMRNKSVSDLRNPNRVDFYSWNITREFSDIPSLQDNVFISTNKLLGTISLPAADSTLNIRMDHFPTGNSVNPFICQIGLDIIANRPIPYKNEPQTLNLRRG